VFFEREAAIGVLELGAPFQQAEVSKELARLERLGMLKRQRAGRSQTRGRKFYRRTASPLWSIVSLAADLARE
jgi:hypothetical protein